MAARCAVCGSEGLEVREHVTAGGERYGMPCPGECSGLLFEAHFIRATGGDEHEHALVLWRWRRRRAEVEGRTFLERPPESAAERALTRLVHERGWDDVARELA